MLMFQAAKQKLQQTCYATRFIHIFNKEPRMWFCRTELKFCFHVSRPSFGSKIMMLNNCSAMYGPSTGWCTFSDARDLELWLDLSFPFWLVNLSNTMTTVTDDNLVVMVRRGRSTRPRTKEDPRQQQWRWKQLSDSHSLCCILIARKISSEGKWYQAGPSLCLYASWRYQPTQVRSCVKACK